MLKLQLFAILIFACLACACGPGNTVRLAPPPAIEAASLPSPNAPSVTVVEFSDKRVDPEIVGKRRDGSAFITSGDVPQWISRSLADELARKGFRVSYATSAAEATRGNPDYLVTGSVEQFWLTETSAVQLQAAMRVKCSLANRKGRIWTETTNSSQTVGGLLSQSSTENLLSGTLVDLTRPIAQKIASSIQPQK